MHLMTSGKARRRRNKHQKKKGSDKKGNKLLSRYDLKGKGREPGTRPDKTAQIRLDREFAEEEQARFYEEGIKDKKFRKREKQRLLESKRKNAKKAAKVKSHLNLTQWIETPSPTPGAKAPEASPIRALKQLPSGGYLAKAWTEDAEDKPNTAGHKISAHTRRRIQRKQDYISEKFISHKSRRVADDFVTSLRSTSTLRS